MNSEKHPSTENWDAALGRALNNLPERQAPATLLPRIMARTQAHAAGNRRQRLWKRWTFWASATASALLLVTGSWLGSQFYENKISPMLAGSVDICRTVFHALAGSLIGSNFGSGAEAYHFALMAGSLFLLIMYITCVGVGSCVYRVVRR
jgi:hypothetical protein